MLGESNVETYITMLKIDSQWEFVLCLRELKQGFCINLDGWDGKGDSLFMLIFDRNNKIL